MPYERFSAAPRYGAWSVSPDGFTLQTP